MKPAILLLGATILFGCVGYPSPRQHFATASALLRAAREVGANDVPEAQLHLVLGEEAIAKARALMDEGQNERADYMTLRAYNDAELALALTRENAARLRARTAAEKTRRVVP